MTPRKTKRIKDIGNEANQLQFGRGDDTAENILKGKETMPKKLLQFGRGDDTAENLGLQSRRDFLTVLQFGRGDDTAENAETDFNPTVFGGASIRPR